MNSMDLKSCSLRSPDSSPTGHKNPINLPTIKVPEMYPSMATPVSTPSLDNSSSNQQHYPSAPYNWANTTNSSTPSMVALPVTPLQTPQSANISSWAALDDDRQRSPQTTYLPSLKSIGENLLRPASASNTQLPPLATPPSAAPLPTHFPASQYHHQPPYYPQQQPPPPPPQSQPQPQLPQEHIPPQPLQHQKPPLLVQHMYPQSYPYPPAPSYHPGYPMPPSVPGLGIYPQQHQFQNQPPPPPPNYFQGYPKPMSQPLLPTQYKTQLLELASSREIKRRTKTGCLTCRKRRIKCDERHPTCFNCDKSKRVCLGYDPLFKATHDRRRTKKEGKSTDEETKEEPLSTTGSWPVDSPESPKSVAGVDCCAPPLDSATATTTNATTRTPSISNSTDNTSPLSNHALPYAETRSKMNINSLLDAAAVIESSSPQPKRKLEDAPELDLVSKKICATGCNLEDRSCDTWDLVEKFFVEHVAVFLDSVIGTSRFSLMPILDMAKGSGLPLDGNGTVNIPACTSGSLRKVTSDGETSDSSNGTNSATNTVRVGQNIATLEAVRQMLSILYPNFYLDNLSIDEGSVGKLEELRISNDYRLLRAVVQLISSTKDTQFLPIGDKDHDLMQRIQALHRFITGGGDPNQPKTAVADKPDLQDNVATDMETIFGKGLAQADCTELWKILVLVASNQQELTSEQEESFVEFASTCGPQHALRVPLLLGAHYYLLTRRPQKQITTGRDSNLRLLLLESCSMSVSNVVSRRLVNMMMN